MAGQQDVENLPIDIHYNKLSDWLVSRRHCLQQWQPAAHRIREKINSAVEDMPAVEEITSMLKGAHINYFHCKKIISLLEDSGSGAKNIFGQYSSQKMKDWQEVVKLYEKDCVYLAEAAQILARNVNYEIPALKKQISKCQQIQRECERKETEYVSGAARLRQEYNATCKQMGIEGKKIKSELAALVRDLPGVFDKLAEKSKHMQSAVEYYTAFVDFITNRNELAGSVLPMLRYVQKEGNTTTYQYTRGVKPDRVDETSIYIDTADEEDKQTNNVDIDWGEPDNAAEIDFSADIDFDIAGISVEGGGTEEGTDGGGIDWGIETTETPADTNQSECVARGEDALCILDNPKTRNVFVDDLSELECFLSQRLVEMTGDGDVLTSSHSQSAPMALQVDVTKVTEMLEGVRSITEQLTSVQMHHLMLIRNSPRYVDRLRDTLRQKLQLADKMLFHQRDAVSRRNGALEEQRHLEPEVDLLVRQTKELQKQIQGEISKKYKNRPVNIMGEINII